MVSRCRPASGTRRGQVQEITITQFPANPAAVAVARSLGFKEDELAARRAPGLPCLHLLAPLRLSVTAPKKAKPWAPFPTEIATARRSIRVHEAVFDRRASAQKRPSDANLVAIQRATDQVDRLLRHAARCGVRKPGCPAGGPHLGLLQRRTDRSTVACSRPARWLASVPLP